MSTYQFFSDPQHPNACTVVLPSGRRLRILEYEDGRVRIRGIRCGPAVLTECYLRDGDVLLSILPTNGLQEHRIINKTPITQIVSDAKALLDYAENVILTMSGLIEQVQITAKDEVSQQQRQHSLKLIEETIRNLMISSDNAGDRSRIEGRLRNVGHYLKTAGLVPRVRKYLGNALGAWNGKNPLKKSLESLVKRIDALVDATSDEEVKKRLQQWPMIKSKIHSTRENVTSSHTGVCQLDT